MVGKAAGLRAERSGVLIWVGTRGFSLFQNVLPALRTTEPPVQWVPGFFPRGIAGGGRCRPSILCRSYERVELYLYCPFMV